MTDTLSPAFLTAFKDVVGLEGGYDRNPNDRGNYTPGGTLKGTKFGISARSYPDLDIPNLTLDQAQAIYFEDYWSVILADQLPSAIALLVFDDAVNSGVRPAVKRVQALVEETRDGRMGPITLGVVWDIVRRKGVPELVVELLASRIRDDAALTAWNTFGLGWSRRLFTLALEEIQMPTSLSEMG